jgi:transitional endoplasmic reticulum ATPase
VLAATNRPDQIDSALMRPGRFDSLIYVPPPDLQGRLDTLLVLSRNIPLGASVSLQAVAQATEHFTGAELQLVCQEALLLGCRKGKGQLGNLEQEDFDEVLSGMHPALSDTVLQQFEEWGDRYAR